MTQEQKFYELLFGYAEGQIVGWASVDGRSRWYSRWQDLERWATTKGREHDAYFSCLTRHPDLPPNIKERGKAQHTYELCGLWADIDYQHPVHKKSAKLPTRDEAFEFILSLPIPPTVIIESGHGFQIWWMLKEPYTILDEVERRYVESITFGWQAQIRRLIGDRGWVIDSVADLARVMRAPGSYNFKAVNQLGEAEPKPVEILELHEDRIYDISEFEPFLVEDAHDLPVEVAHIDFDPDAAVSNDTIEYLRSIDPEFEKVWMKKGKAPDDPSQSGWDMRLAIMVAKAGFSDQEIVNLLINYRRKLGEDLKHSAYYRLTVANARVYSETARRDAVSEQAMTGLKAAELGTGSTDRDRIRENLSAVLGIEIARLVKYMSTPAEYRLILADGQSIRIASTRQIIRAAEFQVIMAEVAKKYITFDRKEWPTIAANLLAIVEEEFAGGEAVDTEHTKILIATYLSRHKIADSFEAAFEGELSEAPQPFVDNDGYVYVSGKEFRSWTESDSKTKLGPKEMGVRFREIGGESVTKNLLNTSRQVWRFEMDVLDPYIRFERGKMQQVQFKSEVG